MCITKIISKKGVKKFLFVNKLNDFLYKSGQNDPLKTGIGATKVQRARRINVITGIKTTHPWLSTCEFKCPFGILTSVLLPLGRCLYLWTFFVRRHHLHSSIICIKLRRLNRILTRTSSSIKRFETDVTMDTVNFQVSPHHQ